MGLMDKVKTQASQLADKAQERAQSAGQKGQAKLNQFQARRAADTLARRIGVATYLGADGRTTAEATKVKVDAAVAELRQLLAEHPEIDLAPETAGTGPGEAGPGGTATDTPSGTSSDSDTGS
jgi:hypothetical protein